MAETKKTLVRLGGKSLAGLIRLVRHTSKAVYEPADVLDRLADTHPCVVACWHGQFMMVAALRPENTKVAAMVARHGDAELIGEAMQALVV
jgi:3-deoxy-D-manno-octulosonic-acid transferase